jgi:uncharacterized membrane protein (UPF0182 family)
MRLPSDLPPRAPKSRRSKRRLSGRVRVVIAVVVGLLVVLFLSARGIAGFYTDYLWYESLGQTGVWTRTLSAKGVLALIFVGAFFALMWVNLFIADRLAPVFRPAGPEEDLVERYRSLIGKRANLVRIGVSLVFAFIAGAGVSTQWREWLLFLNAQ